MYIWRTGNSHQQRDFRPDLHQFFRQQRYAAVGDDAVVVLPKLLRLSRRQRVERLEVRARGGPGQRHYELAAENASTGRRKSINR